MAAGRMRGGARDKAKGKRRKAKGKSAESCLSPFLPSPFFLLPSLIPSSDEGRGRTAAAVLCRPHRRTLRSSRRRAGVQLGVDGAEERLDGARFCSAARPVGAPLSSVESSHRLPSLAPLGPRNAPRPAPIPPAWCDLNPPHLVGYPPDSLSGIGCVAHAAWVSGNRRREHSLRSHRPAIRRPPPVPGWGQPRGGRSQRAAR